MLTLIEIDGFKTFKDFKVELAPFLLALMTTRLQGKNAPSYHATKMVPVMTPGTTHHFENISVEEKTLEVYTLDMVRKYLDSDTLNEAHEYVAAESWDGVAGVDQRTACAGQLQPLHPNSQQAPQVRAITDKQTW